MGEPEGVSGVLAITARYRAAGLLPAGVCETADIIAARLIEDDPAAMSRPVIETLAKLTSVLGMLIENGGISMAAVAAMPGLVAAELERKAADA
jgi:hypothetical protein